jgi:galactokinase
MMGGGFGGCTINIVKSEKVESFTTKTRKAYEDAFGIALLSYTVHVRNGSSVIEN